MTFKAAILIVALLAGGCAGFERGDPLPDASSDASAGQDVSFATVHALLLSGCQRCHKQGGEAGDTPFRLDGDTAADLAVIAKLVDTRNPPASRLLAKMTGQGHGGGTVYGPASREYTQILGWIREGAKP